MIRSVKRIMLQFLTTLIDELVTPIGEGTLVTYSDLEDFCKENYFQPFDSTIRIWLDEAPNLISNLIARDIYNVATS